MDEAGKDGPLDTADRVCGLCSDDDRGPPIDPSRDLGHQSRWPDAVEISQQEESFDGQRAISPLIARERGGFDHARA